MEINIKPVCQFDLKHQPDHIVAFALGNIEQKSRTQIVQHGLGYWLARDFYLATGDFLKGDFVGDSGDFLGEE